MRYVLDRICKHSIRYKQETITPRDGPATVYLPNEMFVDHTKPPAVVRLQVTLA